MSAVWTWVRLDLRERVRSLAVLALLIAVTSGVILTAIAGARRGESALDRLVERTKPATVAALPNQSGFDWDPVAALPGVEAVGRFAVAEFVVDGAPADGNDFPYGAGVMVDIEAPVVLQGRLADERRDDEAVITAAYQESTGIGVGDTVTVRLYSPEQVDELPTATEIPEPAGPVIETTIVGKVRSPWFSDSGSSAKGRLIPSNGLLEQHEANLVGAAGMASVNALVRLEDGAAGVGRFREQLAEVSGRNDIEFMDLAGEGHHLQDVAAFESAALLAFAAAAFVAALFLVGQTVIRFVASSASDLRVLHAVGMRPRHVRIAAAAAPVAAAVLGSVVGVVGAFFASSRFPTGTAAPFEPAPGRQADVLVLGLGLLLFPLLVAAGAVATSWSSSHALGVVRTARRSRVAALSAQAGAPVPVTVGASFALERGRGSQAVPVLPALVGAVVGVVGVVSALTFAAGVRDATDHPERFGQVADLQAFVGFGGEDFLPADEALAAMAAVPGVRAVNDSRQGVLESGAVDMAAYAIDPVDAAIPIVVLDGRAPGSPEEVVLAAQTAADLDAAVGDRIELTGSRSSGRYAVSGIGFVPEGSHNSYDGGAWVPREVYEELIEGFKFHVVEIAVEPGADVDAVRAEVGAGLAALVGAPPEAGSEIVTPLVPPSRLEELRQVQRLPLLLAAFLALLAVAAVGHAVSSAVRRRRHDLAVLRAVGITRGQTRTAVLVQALVLSGFGLTFGVPLGFVLGRVLWRSVATSTPVEYVPPVALWALALIGPVALLTALVLAAWPSHRAANLRVAIVLRTE